MLALPATLPKKITTHINPGPSGDAAPAADAQTSAQLTLPPATGVRTAVGVWGGLWGIPADPPGPRWTLPTLYMCQWLPAVDDSPRAPRSTPELLFPCVSPIPAGGPHTLVIICRVGWTLCRAHGGGDVGWFFNTVKGPPLRCVLVIFKHSFHHFFACGLPKLSTPFLPCPLAVSPRPRIQVPSTSAKSLGILVNDCTYIHTH